jgi:Flp pilus assembly protein TadB
MVNLENIQDYFGYLKPDVEHLLLALVSLGLGLTAYGLITLVSKVKLRRKSRLANILAVDPKTKKQTLDSFTNWTTRLEQRLPKDFKVKPSLMLLALIVFVAGIPVFNNPVPALLLAILFLIVPSQVIFKIKQAHREKVEEQLARAVRVFAAEFSVTPQLERGFAAVAKTVENPVGGIFKRACNRLTYRHDVDAVLTDLALSLNTVHGYIFVQLLRAARKHGKAIAPLLYELISKITVAQELDKKNKSEISGERVLSMIMAISPLPVYFILNNWTPDTQEFLRNTVVGRFVVMASFASAITWMVMDRLLGGSKI